MQGILMSHFKQVEKYLTKLQEGDYFDLTCTHIDTIVAHEKKLAEIYESYRQALQNVEVLISDFKEHKKSVRRLIMEHKRCKKMVKQQAVSLYQ